jgi:hypothetical protein
VVFGFFQLAFLDVVEGIVDHSPEAGGIPTGCRQ